MNKTQKNFRKQIKQLEKEGYLEPGTFKPQRTNQKKHGFLPFVFAIAIILLLVYGSTRTGNHNLNSSQQHSISVNPDEEQIADYVNKTNHANQLKRETFDMLHAVIQIRESYKQELLQQKLNQVIKVKDEMKTDNPLLGDLEKNSLEQLNLLEDLLVYSLTHYHNETSNEWINKYNSTNEQLLKLHLSQVEILTNLLKAEDMEYEIKDDGSIYFRYHYQKKTC